MSNSRTKNSFLTLATSGVRQLLTILLTFASRTIFIQILGAEYLGLNGLFSNILSLLALSELGIGSAIAFYLYKPLANKNYERIKALMKFYKQCYMVVGVVIVTLGSLLMPFLPNLVNLPQGVHVNLYLVYFLFLLNTASSYLCFAYKQALVIANQEQYKIEKINIVFCFINCLTDIIILIIFRSFVIYLLAKLLLVITKNYITAMKIDREYHYITEKVEDKISILEVKKFFKDTFNVALFRVGSTFFNATDNIIISVWLGTIVVGYYSNYTMIIGQVVLIIGIIIRSFVAGIGNVIAEEHLEKQFDIYKQLDFLVYVVSLFCTVYLFQLLNSFIMIWIGHNNIEYVLNQCVVFFLCINFYFDSTTQVPNSFREASGNFNTGKNLQLIGGLFNVILSIILCKMFGLSGVIAATVLGKGLITVTPFIMGISKDVFGFSKSRLLIRYYFNMFVMLCILGINWMVCYGVHMKGITSFIIEFVLSSIITTIGIFLFFYNKPEMKIMLSRIRYALNKE